MQNAAEVRERLFTMRMSEEEWQRADALAKHFGLNLAGVIRMVLKEKAREVGVEPAAAAPPLDRLRALVEKSPPRTVKPKKR